MMCKCEEEFAVKFLPHQIRSGSELETQREVKVTLGFQPGICNTCKGKPEEAHPKAEMHGCTSKIKRYYWREIAFEKIKKFEKFVIENNYSDWIRASIYHPKEYNVIEKEVVEEIKQLHKISPKYKYNEESQEALINKYKLEVIKLSGEHVKFGKSVLIIKDDQSLSPEEFAVSYFNELGYKTIFCESVPFHVLFGVFTWVLIQGPGDTKNKFIGFGNRDAFAQGFKVPMWSSLPQDFGTKGYFLRRKKRILLHIDSLASSTEELLQTFSMWETGSIPLRQYLWANRKEDVERARNILKILPAEVVKKILQYLIENYWQRYLGWPDLLVYNDSGYFFVEVKSSKDKLSEDQKNWIRGNEKILKLPFKLLKIHNTFSNS